MMFTLLLWAEWYNLLHFPSWRSSWNWRMFIFDNYHNPDDVNRTNRTPNQLNAIECNRMIEIRLPNAIESQSNITVIFSIDSTYSIASKKFDWLLFSEVTLNPIEYHLNLTQNFNRINRILPRISDSIDISLIAFDNWIAIIRLHPNVFNWFDWNFCSIPFDWHRLVILVNIFKNLLYFINIKSNAMWPKNKFLNNDTSQTSWMFCSQKTIFILSLIASHV